MHFKERVFVLNGVVNESIIGNALVCFPKGAFIFQIELTCVYRFGKYSYKAAIKNGLCMKTPWRETISLKVATLNEVIAQL